MYLSGAPGTGVREVPLCSGRLVIVALPLARLGLGRALGMIGMIGDWTGFDHFEIRFLKIPKPP